MQNTQGIVKRPIITEKATMLSEQMNRFTFEVIQSANKIEIKNAIERMYGDADAEKAIDPFLSFCVSQYR